MKYLFIFLATALIGFWAVIYWKDYAETSSLNEQRTETSTLTSASVTIVPTLQKGIESSDFALRAPSAAVTGKVVQVTGNVTIMRRESTEYVTLNEGDAVFDGESIVTEDGTVTIDFPTVGSVILQEDTHVILANMIPANFLVEQVAGFIDVTSTVPVSVRVGALLVSTAGKQQIDLQEDTITLSLEKGTSTFGFVNAENETEVVTLAEGTPVTFTASTLEVSR